MVRPRIFQKARESIPKGSSRSKIGRILDEKQGLAKSQPGIEVDDSLFLFEAHSLDERRFQAPRSDLLEDTPWMNRSSSWRQPVSRVAGYDS